MFHFFVTKENGEIVKACDVHEALRIGMPDFYRLCHDDTVLYTGKTVLSTLIPASCVHQAGGDVDSVLNYFGRSHFDEYEDDMFLYPLSKKLYLHHSYTHCYSPYTVMLDGRVEFDQEKFCSWVLNMNQAYSPQNRKTDDNFSMEFQSIFPLLVLAWHKNQPDPTSLIEDGNEVVRASNGQILALSKL